MVTHSSCDRTSRAYESIPSPRHRAKAAPQEQSLWLTCCTSLVRGSWTGLCNHFFAKQHDRTGEDGCLITLDHFGARFLRRTINPTLSQVNCQNRAVWTSRTILSKPMLYLSRR